jgi:hypothetical protein
LTRVDGSTEVILPLPVELEKMEYLVPKFLRAIKNSAFEVAVALTTNPY